MVKTFEGTGGVHVTERVAFSSDGMKHFEISATGITDPDGKVSASIEMVEDITDRKRAEEELLNSNRILNRVLDGISDIIGIQNPDYSVVRYNKAGYETLCLSHGDAVGKAVIH